MNDRPDDSNIYEKTRRAAGAWKRLVWFVCAGDTEAEIGLYEAVMQRAILLA